MIGTCEYNKKLVSRPLIFLEYPIKLTATQQSLVAGEGIYGWHGSGETVTGGKRDSTIIDTSTTEPVQSACTQVVASRKLDSFAYQGVSLARPRARRRLITARPALVAIRARKPWVRARFRLLGWNVRFIGLPIVYCVAVPSPFRADEGYASQRRVSIAAREQLPVDKPRKQS